MVSILLRYPKFCKYQLVNLHSYETLAFDLGKDMPEFILHEENVF